MARNHTRYVALFLALFVACAARGGAAEARAGEAGEARAARGGAAEARAGEARGARQALAGEVPSSRGAQPPLEYRLDELSISLSRGACEDDCPVYTVAVHGSGLVAYQGEENVKAIGQRLTAVSPEEVTGLLEEIYAADLSGLRDQYLSSHSPKVTEDGTVMVAYRGATGSARRVLILKIRNFTKRIVFQPEHAPAELVKLTAFIDNLTDSRRWTGQ